MKVACEAYRTLGDIPKAPDEKLDYEQPNADENSHQAMQSFHITDLQKQTNTPHKVSSGNAHSIESLSHDSKELLTTRRAEAHDLAKDYAKLDISGILDLAIPDAEDARKAAEALGTDISDLVEKLVQ
ncbi:hypothetical protein LPJ59_000457 [Coemansia sp. RSA 2399]|nr:hypothetical protein LPJ59_000457 [Coemansia sp. RSA 2399]